MISDPPPKGEQKTNVMSSTKAVAKAKVCFSQ